jgi:hypothetical protein
MRATTIMLSLASLLLTGAFSLSLTRPAQPAATQPVPWHVRPNQSGMHTCGFCSQRRQDGCWDRVGLYPADYGRDATTEGGQRAFAATRPAARGGMQGAESQFRNGWRATLILQDSTVEIHEIKHNGVYGTMTVRYSPRTDRTRSPT